MSERGETPIDHSEEISSVPEAKQLKGIELLQSQADRLSGLIQKELESEEPNTAEEEEEFQEYMRGWVAEYQRLSQAGPDNQKEALEVLGMIRALLGDLPVEEGLLPVKVYGILPPPDENDSTQGEIG